VEKPKGLKAVFNLRREDLPFALLMFGYFFLVITSFWILKPVKKTIFITFYDQTGFDLLNLTLSAAQAELIAKVLNMVVAFVAVVVFSALSDRLRRQHLTYAFSGFFLFSYAAYSFLLSTPDDFTVWSFYLFGDLFSTLMVATFFAFLNDSVTPDESKKIYGLVGFGGVTGGAFGSMVVRGFISKLPSEQWMWVCGGLVLAIAGLAMGAGRIVDRNPPPEQPRKETPEPQTTGNPAVQGAQLVFRSPYLLSIVAIVGLYEIVSTVLDFQFSATVAHYVSGPAIGEHFATVFMITNIVAMLVQLLLTSYVMTNLGVGIALLILPFAILAGSAGFLALPILWMGSMLNTADNAFSYSINQSAKEALYVPTSKEEKYKAKAFIDMFVQRFAKAVAVGVSLGITLWFDDFASVRWLSLFTLPIILVWILAARYAGRHFAEVTEQEGG
jgi:AAA family ATP:ADP antiporter